MKQQDVSSTRNALRLAMQAEAAGRGTIGQLGAQAERSHNTEMTLEIGNNQSHVAEHEVKEVKPLNRSIVRCSREQPFHSQSP